MEKNEFGSLPYTIHTELHKRAKTVRCKKTGISLHGLGIGNGFLDMTPKENNK